MAARFKQALQKTESTRDAEHIVSLFAKDAQLTNLGGEHEADAKTFWQAYLAQFREIASEFTGEVVSDKQAALEWKSRGTTAEGHEIEYRGVSVIEFGAEAVTSFRTYYDSAMFVHGQKA